MTAESEWRIFQLACALVALACTVAMWCVR
jgi:hypothetical protein